MHPEVNRLTPADNCSDLADSDSDNDSDASTDSDSDSDEIPIEAGGASLLLSQPQTEFKREVKLSLDRAFEEGHSVDNAAVELKTLRMASNVPLVHVRTGVVAAIVDRIPIVEGNPGEQRQAIGKMIGRWGELINRIGGIDGVETVTVLQVRLDLTDTEVVPVPVRDGFTYTRSATTGTVRVIETCCAVWAYPGCVVSAGHCG